MNAFRSTGVVWVVLMCGSLASAATLDSLAGGSTQGDLIFDNFSVLNANGDLSSVAGGNVNVEFQNGTNGLDLVFTPTSGSWSATSGSGYFDITYDVTIVAGQQGSLDLEATWATLDTYSLGSIPVISVNADVLSGGNDLGGTSVSDGNSGTSLADVSWFPFGYDTASVTTRIFVGDFTGTSSLSQFTHTWDTQTQQVPEPATMGLLGLGGLALLRRRRRA